MPPNVTTLYSDRHNILDSLTRADLLIGAVLIPGARAPFLVRRDDLKRMPRALGHHRRRHRPGRLHRNLPADHAQPADLHRGGRGPLLRHEHARRRGPDQHLCPDQRDAAVRVCSWPTRVLSGPCQENKALAMGVNIKQGQGDQRRRRPDVQTSLRPGAGMKNSEVPILTLAS